MTRIAFIVLVLIGLGGPALAQEANGVAGVTGVWLNDSGDAHIRIARCGPSLCGTIIWLKQPTDPATGRPVTDKKNPDAAKRSRPMLGVEVAIGFQPSHDEPGKYVGSFYNAEDGGIYRGSMMPQNADTLRVEGCVLMFCQTQTWTRISH